MKIPNNCYECKFTSCDVLPRWAGAKYFENYRNKRHKNCPFNAMERKTGHWVKVGGFVTPGGDPVWRCSECGKGMHTYGIEAPSYAGDVSDHQWVSCPNCDAKMDGESE